MTTLLTTMRQRLADAEHDAERLRAAIQILEQADATPSARRPARARTQPKDGNGRPQQGREPAAAESESAATITAAARPAGTSARRSRKPAATKQKAKTVVPLEKLLKVVEETPGMTTTALATHTGGDQSALLELLKESEQKGDVRREGERRATSWYRITDEDRVAARAAELAAQSRSKAKASTRPTKQKGTPAG